MLRNSIQHYQYHKLQEKNQLIKTLKIMRFPIHISWIFAVLTAINKYFFSDYEIGLSVMFWAVIIILIYYWMPNKKEYIEWKKTHSTF